jgi:hypothetical protein
MQMKVVCFTSNSQRDLSLKNMRHTKAEKELKERISVLLCCNAQGEKLKPLIIGNAARPRDFKMNNVKLDGLPVMWHYNKKAWMTSERFSEWLNRKMKWANQKILLFVDNARSHVDLNLFNFAVRFLPPNLTSEVQLLDKGIIQSMKLQYRKQMMWALINAAGKCNSVAEFTRSVTVLDAVRWVHGAWGNVSPETMFRSVFDMLDL